jgi:hypothetical protein
MRFLTLPLVRGPPSVKELVEAIGNDAVDRALARRRLTFYAGRAYRDPVVTS